MHKSLCDQIWPWHKIGQGQPRVIIWTTLVVLPYTMLYTKFQGHPSIGSGEEYFLRFLPYTMLYTKFQGHRSIGSGEVFLNLILFF